jgi:hypothetical protein
MFSNWLNSKHLFCDWFENHGMNVIALPFESVGLFFLFIFFFVDQKSKMVITTG